MGGGGSETAGSGTILSGRDSCFIPNSEIVSGTFITTITTNNPSSMAGSCVVEWIERQIGGKGFTIHMSNVVANDTKIEYFIIS